MGRMPIVLVGPPLKKRAGPPSPSVGSILQPREVQRGKRESASEGRGGPRGKERRKERSSPSRREARRELVARS